jgi:hypothetical protein
MRREAIPKTDLMLFVRLKKHTVSLRNKSLCLINAWIQKLDEQEGNFNISINRLVETLLS